MSTIDNFGFGEEEQMLRDSARKFFTDNLSGEQLAKLVANSPETFQQPACAWDKKLWQQMVDLGWTTVSVPERAGGMAMNFAAVVGLVEEAGRAAFPSPLQSTISASYVLDACRNQAADHLLVKIAGGETASLAIMDSTGAWYGVDAAVEEHSGCLNGSAWFVQDALKTDSFVVRAKSAAGVGLYQVESTADGLSVVADNITDLTRDQAHLVFDQVKVTAVLAKPGQAESVVKAAEPALLTILAADMCGAAEWQLQTTADYARVREQFDKPIGSFQAIKHPLVDLMAMIDCARSHTYNAAEAISFNPDNAERCARMAKAAASDAAAYGCSRSVQFHGGIGFTWECFVHIYFKRQKHSEMLMGDAFYQRARLAETIIGPLAA